MTNIWSLGKRSDLKFGEMSYLFISYHIIISWLYTLDGFRILFSLRDSATQEYKWGIMKYWPHSHHVKTSTRIAIIYLFIFSDKEFEGKKLESLYRAWIKEFAYFRSREDIATRIVTAPLILEWLAKQQKSLCEDHKTTLYPVASK